MRLKVILSAFAFLLAISTATAFIGYYYLGLASEYRERNFLHLSKAQALIEVFKAAPSIREAEIEQARGLLSVTQAQAEWCLDILSPLEKWMFAELGAGGALDVCALDVLINNRLRVVLDELEVANHYEDARGATVMSLNRDARDYAHMIHDDSLAFHPFVSIIEDKLKEVVRSGTTLTVLGLCVAFVIIAQDLLKSQRIQRDQTRALRKQTKELGKLAAIAERANDSIILTDTDGRITWVNPSFERLTGRKLAEVKGKRPGSLLHGPETDLQTKVEIGQAIRNRTPVKRNILNYTKLGKPYWISLSISALKTAQGDTHGFVAISSDISREVEQRQAIDLANREIKHRSLHDPLTDLPNRRALDSAMRDRITQKQPTTLLVIDLDHFKYINDTLGHKAGDFVLEHVAQIIREETREDDLPARVGGDEFIILLSGDQTAQDGCIIAKRILSRIRKPTMFEGKSIRIGGSFGVASTFDKLLSAEDLIVGADAALYEAKESGRNRVHLYTPQLHTEIEARHKMARELKKAVAREEFTPYFQPQFDAQSRKLIGVETLARSHSSSLGPVMPQEFLPVAHRLSISEEIDDIIFRKAVPLISPLHQAGLGLDKLSFNVSAHRIYDPKVVRMVRAANTGTLKITFEVLETVLVEDQGDLFHYGIDALREAGVSIEVDDFGSGHASIIGLMKLQPDAMKIDRRLVENIDSRSLNREMVKNIVNIAQSLDLTVIAEGVETIAQADILAEIGCHVLQGYALAKPMPIEDLTEFVLGSAIKNIA